MLEHDRFGLFPMALGASLVQTAYRQTARRFLDVHPMRVMALDTAHFPFEHRMMLGKMEFSLRFRVALEARGGIFAGIQDKFLQATTAAHGDVFAAWTMAGFAAVLAAHRPALQMQARVRAGSEDPGDILVTICASFV